MRRAPLLLLFVFSLSALAQVPTIVEEIGELEQVRDPKCYATASRLEDFIYGTPLESETRFEKIALQKQFIRAAWTKASASSGTEITVDALKPVLQSIVPYAQTPDGSWIVGGDTVITARDKRQYGSVAYALRAILAVQQDALLEGAALKPLTADAVEAFKESIDLVTLAALQKADRQSRKGNHQRVQPEVLKAAWKSVVPGAARNSPPSRPSSPRSSPHSRNTTSSPWPSSCATCRSTWPGTCGRPTLRRGASSRTSSPR